MVYILCDAHFWLLHFNSFVSHKIECSRPKPIWSHKEPYLTNFHSSKTVEWFARWRVPTGSEADFSSPLYIHFIHYVFHNSALKIVIVLQRMLLIKMMKQLFVCKLVRTSLWNLRSEKWLSLWQWRKSVTEYALPVALRRKARPDVNNRYNIIARALKPESLFGFVLLLYRVYHCTLQLSKLLHDCDNPSAFLTVQMTATKAVI
jgi:hypothetical protein